MTNIVPVVKTRPMLPALEEHEQFVTMMIKGQLCGLPVLKVRNVLNNQKVTKIPLAPREVAGSLNLRGRIVTVIDLRLRMGLEPRQSNEKSMSIVVENAGNLYGLMVDSVEEVMVLSKKDYEKSPSTLDAHWREMSKGIYRLENRLLLVLDIDHLLSFGGIA